MSERDAAVGAPEPRASLFQKQQQPAMSSRNVRVDRPQLLSLKPPWRRSRIYGLSACLASPGRSSHAANATAGIGFTRKQALPYNRLRLSEDTLCPLALPFTNALTLCARA